MNKLLKTLSSLKITVICLLLFFILTFWGTIYQAEYGLYEAQEKFFWSWFFPLFGFLPFPGVRLVLWVLFVNLLAAFITRFRFLKTPSKTGILIIHIGLLTFFLSAFMTFHLTEETNVTLLENEGTNLASAYADWEIAVWDQESVGTNLVFAQSAGRSQGSPLQNGAQHKTVTAYDTKYLKSGDTLSFDEYGFSIVVQEYYSNANAYAKHQNAYDPQPLNYSNIVYLSEERNKKEPEENLPGFLFAVKPNDGSRTTEMLLFGGEGVPTSLSIGEKTLQLELQRRKSQIPFLIKLLDFRREMHPGTEVAKSYESTVEIDGQGGKREVIISMNNPLRYKGYTFYQASYAIDEIGREYSTFATVKNQARLAPYISSILTFLGLAVHFVIMFVTRVKQHTS